MEKERMRKLKKKLLSLAVSFTLLLGQNAFAAATDPAQFGDNVQRTHFNGINDPIPWKNAALIRTDVTTDIWKFPFNLYGGNGTPVAQDNFLVFPVSAPNDDPLEQGYVAVYDMKNWNTSNPNDPRPATKWATQITGVSNSAPIVYNGKVYLAAGKTLYGFDLTSGAIFNYLYGNIGASTSNTVYRNQVVSHPLYVKADQQGTSQDIIWVSSQNGWLFAINPNDLGQVYQPINLGARLDGSPSLITPYDPVTQKNVPYIVVGSAYHPNNQPFDPVTHTGGTGTLFVIDPRTGTVVDALPSQRGGSPIVTAPIGTGNPGEGFVMWNDYAGNVFFYTLDAQGHFSYVATWDQVGGAGVTTNEEAGFSKQTGYYVLPFSGGRYTVVINANNPAEPPQKFEYLPQAQSSSSSPILSSKFLYVADNSGIINQIKHDKPTFSNGGLIRINFSAGDVPNLTTPVEAILGTQYGADVPTIALTTTSGLQIFQSIGANYDFGSNVNSFYTAGQKITFTQPLTLTLKESNLDKMVFANEKLDISYAVDGGAYTPLTTVNVYKDPVTPNDKITITTDAMNAAAQTWSDAKQHEIVFKVKKNSNNQAEYRFTSADSGELQEEATVTYTFTNGGPVSLDQTNLSIKFDPFTMPIAVGTATIPFTVANDGENEVTTQVKFTRNGQKPVPVYVAEYDAQGNYIGDRLDHYDNVPDTQVVTQTITIPGKSAKKLNFSVWTGRRILGTSSTGFYDDPNYKFEVIASVNESKNPGETTYSDNQVRMWISTTGLQKSTPGVVLEE